MKLQTTNALKVLTSHFSVKNFRAFMKTVLLEKSIWWSKMTLSQYNYLFKKKKDFIFLNNLEQRVYLKTN